MGFHSQALPGVCSAEAECSGRVGTADLAVFYPQRRLGIADLSLFTPRGWAVLTWLCFTPDVTLGGWAALTQLCFTPRYH